MLHCVVFHESSVFLSRLPTKNVLQTEFFYLNGCGSNVFGYGSCVNFTYFIYSLCRTKKATRHHPKCGVRSTRPMA